MAPSGNGGGALGYTLRNDGSSSAGPGPEQIARQAEADRKRIDGWIEDDLAGARASTGMVHDYLGKLRLALQEKASDPKMLPSNPVESFAMAWGAAAQSYANTGNPYSPDAIPEPRPQTSATSALMRQAELWRGGPQDQLVRQEEQARLLREFADGSTGLGLVAIIDIRQAASGEVLALELSQSSGSLPFDQHVLQIAPLAVGTLPAPSADLLRGRDSIRTQWSFEGRITYWRRLDELDRPGDFAYLAALGLVSMAGVPVTGRYDLQSSPMVTDYRNPHFACSVKLLRVY